MATESIGLLVLAILLLFAAHATRAVRHGLLFNPRDLVRRFELLVTLSLTYVINVILPFRIGEIARVLYVAARTQLRISQVAATVVTERVSDLLVVAFLLPVIQYLDTGTLPAGILVTSGAMLAVATAFLVGGALVRSSQLARRLVWKCASIFNDRIMQSLVNLTWMTAELQRSRLRHPRYLACTAVMWTLYCAAYGAFATSVGVSFSDISFTLLGSPLRSLADLHAADNLRLVVFCSLPVLVIILYHMLSDHQAIKRALLLSRHFTLAPIQSHSLDIPHAFRDVGAYGTFLRAHFSASAPVVSSFGTQGVEKAIIHRMLPGGSEALTAVVEVEDQFRIRKFAIEQAAAKLAIQADWLNQFQHEISLCQVIDEAWTTSSYRFDMPYLASGRDFYEFIHMNPVHSGCALLAEIFHQVGSFHESHRGKACDPHLIDAYLQKKVIDNAKQILVFARSMVGESFDINGQQFRLSEWDRLLDLDWLRAQIAHRETTIVHGDLTIENIIVAPEMPRGWYLIDPNPDNIFNTELIDWAKMLQSLNLGYEGLNRALPSSLSGSSIKLMFTRSNAYSTLHADFLALLRQRYDERTLREISFHELVNYLRLTPYKIRHAPEKALTFFACSASLLRAYNA